MTSKYISSFLQSKPLIKIMPSSNLSFEANKFEFEAFFIRNKRVIQMICLRLKTGLHLVYRMSQIYYNNC